MVKEEGNGALRISSISNALRDDIPVRNKKIMQTRNKRYVESSRLIDKSKKYGIIDH